MSEKARQLWLVQGDHSTKYFHAMVNKRRIQNRINQIRDPSGRWIENYSQIEHMAKAYFTNVFSRGGR